MRVCFGVNGGSSFCLLWRCVNWLPGWNKLQLSFCVSLKGRNPESCCLWSAATRNVVCSYVCVCVFMCFYFAVFLKKDGRYLSIVSWLWLRHRGYLPFSIVLHFSKRWTRFNSFFSLSRAAGTISRVACGRRVFFTLKDQGHFLDTGLHSKILRSRSPSCDTQGTQVMNIVSRNSNININLYTYIRAWPIINTCS